MFGHHGRKRSSKEGMWIGKKKREVVEKGRYVLGGAQGPRSQLKSERFCGKGARAPLGARVLLVPQRGGERTHTPSGASETKEQQMPGQASL